MNYIIAVFINNHVWYFDGMAALDSTKKAAHKFTSKERAQKVLKKIKSSTKSPTAIFNSKLTAKYINGHFKQNTKKNPIKGSKKRRIDKAAQLYESFTGHDADEIEKVDLPNYDTGLKVGKCLGIIYETVRDGKKENYIHEFKKASQPDFVISHDGQQIYLLNGSYLFKDSGINDL